MSNPKVKAASQWLRDNYNEVVRDYAGQTVVATENGIVASDENCDEAIKKIPTDVNLEETASVSIPEMDAPAA